MSRTIPFSQVPPAVQSWLNSQVAATRERSFTRAIDQDIRRLTHDDIPPPAPPANNTSKLLAAMLDSAERLGTTLDSINATMAKAVTPRPTVVKPAAPAVRADSAELIAANTRLAALRKEIADMNKRLPAETPADQKEHFTAAQARWERIAEAFGDAQVRRPLNGESLADYNRALMGGYKSHSKAWKEINLYEVPDEVLDIVINQVHADALAAAANPPVVPGKLTMRQHRDAAGRTFNRFHGDIGVMLDLSRNPRQYVTGFPALADRR